MPAATKTETIEAKLWHTNQTVISSIFKQISHKMCFTRLWLMFCIQLFKIKYWNYMTNFPSRVSKICETKFFYHKTTGINLYILVFPLQSKVRATCWNDCNGPVAKSVESVKILFNVHCAAYAFDFTIVNCTLYRYTRQW